ncbi:MAG TPA: CehA/McbA family metallohydrolase [Vicinamibacteria bacterium]|nr:CehA/McbA family metallohydrolase [Vicinamibacteria bacterium]
MKRNALAGALLVASTAFAAAEDAPRVIKAHFTPKQQQVDRYVQVPFDVTPGTTRIDIELKYDRSNGENVVDLGLLEPGSLELGTRAFRGWTGGERSAIFVSATDATPGYWPGPIQAGRWNVGLGLYKVGAAGVDVEVTVRTSVAPLSAAMPSLPARAKEPIRTGPAWYSGALHAHTHHSDGALSAQALAQKARAEGLDFLAITDHNNTASQREIIDVPGLLTLLGEEVTTPGGHANVWGLGGARDFVDFRVSPGDPAIHTLFRAAAGRGALIGINHPYSACVACSWTHPVPDAVNTIEITGREPAEIVRAVALWDMLLTAGRRVTAIGVSDWHRGDTPIGAASVRVWANELSTRAILDSIRAGRVIVMADAATAPPDVRVTWASKEARVGDTLTLARGDAYALDVAVAVDAPLYRGAKAEVFWNGERIAGGEVDAGKFRIERFASTSGYLRVHILAANGAPLAVTNPVWIRTTGR